MNNHKLLPPATFVLGKPTFWGCYLMYRDQITLDRGWNSETRKGYESILLNKIVPNIPGHNQKSLSSLTRADFSVALASIRKDGYIGENGIVCRYDSETLNRFKYLIQVIAKTAEENYICRNVFADTTFQNNVHKHSTPSNRIVPRYMPPEKEQLMGDILLSNPMEDGALIALAGMLCWGARNGEAAGINFEDIKLWQEIPGCWVVWVYKSTKIDSNELQSSGKTRNADRVVLLPDRYVQLIFERKQRIQKLLGPNVDVNKLPVACRGNDYFTRCSADDITSAAKTLFHQLQIPFEHIALVNEEIQHALAITNDSDSQPDLSLIEKEPTAYYLRRVYGTSLACVGLSESEIAFQIGHDFGVVPEYRNEMLNTTKLLEIKAKLDMRPVVNSFAKSADIPFIPQDSVTVLPQSSIVNYRIPASVKQVNLHLATREPAEQLRITIHADTNNPVKVHTTSFLVKPSTYSTELNVIKDLHHLYKNSLIQPTKTPTNKSS